MTLSHDDTKLLIDIVLGSPSEDARAELHATLKRNEQTEGQFYDGIIKHGRGLRLTTVQWFELLSRLPNRFLRSGLDLDELLSEEQLNRLPPVTG